jgi:fatty-acyl-CoA synthase
MCYTSGTTGNPKGVVYSHRSSYLHSMAVCGANALGLTDGDRVLPIVSMYHANAWGQPYAAVMAGSDLLLPDRFLQAAPLVDMIEQRRPTIAAAVPTIWNDVLQHLQANPGRDISSLRLVVCGGSAFARNDEGVPAFSRCAHPQGWGVTEPPLLRSPPHRRKSGEDHWTRGTAGRVL